jgi:hypothetical protein
MILVDERQPWQQVSKEEWLRLRRYILDCVDLSTDERQQVRSEFQATSAHCVKRYAQELGRAPTREEADQLRAAVTRHFNETRIAEIVAERRQANG